MTKQRTMQPRDAHLQRLIEAENAARAAVAASLDAFGAAGLGATVWYAPATTPWRFMNGETPDQEAARLVLWRAWHRAEKQRRTAVRLRNRYLRDAYGLDDTYRAPRAPTG